MVGSVQDFFVEYVQHPDLCLKGLHWLSCNLINFTLSELLSELFCLLRELFSKDFFFISELLPAILDRELFINLFNHLGELFPSVPQFLHKQVTVDICCLFMPLLLFFFSHELNPYLLSLLELLFLFSTVLYASPARHSSYFTLSSTSFLILWLSFAI